jgi:phosphatidylserine/phosphatidylglycerophosphate/cardiolipin synthase-like enzyme
VKKKNLHYFKVVTYVLCAILPFKIDADQTDFILSQQYVRVAFSPGDGITKMITQQIEEAQSSIYVAAYSFTSVPIALKLVEAFERGVDVKVVLDSSQKTAKKSVYALFQRHKLPVKLNYFYKIQHNKYMIFDQKHVECGSFNYTKSAEHNNAENAMILKDQPELAATYMKNFSKLWEESDQPKKPRKRRSYVLVKKPLP